MCKTLAGFYAADLVVQIQPFVFGASFFNVLNHPNFD